MSIGPWQLLIIAIIVLLLFGGSRLADIGKGLGEGIRSLKKGLSDDEKENKQAEEPAPPKQLPAASAPDEDRADAEKRAPEEEKSEKTT
ncbi:MAG: twin-arginine translocase TatA/TatE family subunit [Polyangiaceae bacterium]|nr:twin-arginine translocase TatA/TatE family subunit [Polyangiaceae bacterium]